MNSLAPNVSVLDGGGQRVVEGGTSQAEQIQSSIAKNGDKAERKRRYES